MNLTKNLRDFDSSIPYKSNAPASENLKFIAPPDPCRKNIFNYNLKASGKSESFIHRSQAKKKLKSLKRKKDFSTLNIMSSNIRGLGNKKSSLEDILTTEGIDICTVQEVNSKNPPRFKDYVQFNRFSKQRMHGVLMLVHNSLRQHVIRIPDESNLECVHLRLNHTTPALNII